MEHLQTATITWYALRNGSAPHLIVNVLEGDPAFVRELLDLRKGASDLDIYAAVDDVMPSPSGTSPLDTQQGDLIFGPNHPGREDPPMTIRVDHELAARAIEAKQAEMGTGAPIE